MKLTYIDRVLAALCLLAGVVYTLPASAATLCSSTYTPPGGSTVHGSLEVDASTSSTPCILNDVTVQGSVTVDPGAFFETVNGTTIQGALTATGALVLLDNGTTVDGTMTINDARYDMNSGACGSTFGSRVTIENIPYSGGATGFIFGDPNIPVTVPGAATAPCAGNQVLGSLVLYNNANFVAVESDQVAGAVTVTDNYGVAPTGADTTGAGSVLIKANTIGAALKCTGNVGLGGIGTNNVHAAETGQCVGF